MTTKPETLRVHDDVVYEREGPTGFWWPATDWVLKHYPTPTRAKVDPNAPLLCDCGSTTFSVHSPSGEYETTARCTTCGAKEIVHMG